MSSDTDRDFQAMQVARLTGELTAASTSGGMARIRAGDNEAKLRAATRSHKEEVAKLKAVIQEKDAEITDWKHSWYALRKLARKYGAELHVSDEQRAADMDAMVLAVAEEDPKYRGTPALAAVKERQRLAAEKK